MKQYNKPRKSKALFGLGFLKMISPRNGYASSEGSFQPITWQVPKTT